MKKFWRVIMWCLICYSCEKNQKNEGIILSFILKQVEQRRQKL